MKVRIAFDESRNRWRVDYRVPKAGGGFKRPRIYCASKEDAEKEAAAVRERHKHHGQSGLSVDMDFYRACIQAREELGEATIPQAVEFWLKHHPRANIPKLEDAAWSYMEGKRGKKISDGWERSLTMYLDRFVLSFSSVGIPALATRSDELSRWINGQGPADDTRANVRKVLNGFFRWLHGKGWIGSNPIAAIPSVEIIRPEPARIKVEDMQAVMAHLWRHEAELIPFAALKFFAGMRTSAIYRADWENIRFSARSILLPASKTKAKRRHLATNLPPNLWVWLAPFQQPAGKIAATHFQPRLSAAFERLGLSYPKNAGRHSFASYRVAQQGDAENAAHILSHREGSQVLMDSYQGNAEKAEGRAWFATMPPPKSELRRSPIPRNNPGKPLYGGLKQDTAPGFGFKDSRKPHPVKISAHHQAHPEEAGPVSAAG